MCFYFRLAHLAELSSFFSTLPTPSGNDLVDDTALVPLHDVGLYALTFSLLALRSTLLPDTFDFNFSANTRGAIATDGIIGSAIFAKKYDCPQIFALLLEAIGEEKVTWELCYLIFAIWAISGVERKIAAAAEATLGTDITLIPSYISQAIQNHAPTAWAGIQDLHLRYAAGPGRFKALLLVSGRPTSVTCSYCHLGEEVLLSSVAEQYNAAHTVKDICRVMDRKYGLQCLGCIEVVEDNYTTRNRGLRAFSTRYICTEEDRNYGR